MATSKKSSSSTDIEAVQLPMRVTGFLLQPDGTEILQAVCVNRSGHVALPIGTTEKQSLRVSSPIMVTITSREPITAEEGLQAINTDSVPEGVPGVNGAAANGLVQNSQESTPSARATASEGSTDAEVIRSTKSEPAKDMPPKAKKAAKAKAAKAKK